MVFGKRLMSGFFQTEFINMPRNKDRYNDYENYVLIIGGQTGERGDQEEWQNSEILWWSAKMEYCRTSLTTSPFWLLEAMILGKKNYWNLTVPPYSKSYLLGYKTSLIYRDTEQLFLEDDGKYRSYLGSPRLYNFRLWPLLIPVDDLNYCWFPWSQ